jgi:hypothetical protein
VRFYCEVDSDTGKKPTSRGGHKTMSVHARGWTKGVRVELTKREDGTDFIRVLGTGGSHGESPEYVITTIESEAHA